MANTKSLPIAFLGLADHIEDRSQKFPMSPVDIFQLSQHKVHIIYPAITKDNEWVFVLSHELLEPEAIEKLELRIVDQEGKPMGSVKFVSMAAGSRENEKGEQDVREMSVAVPDSASSLLLHFKVDTVIERPGRYSVELKQNSNYSEIGNVYFHYQPAPQLTADQVKAIQSDLKSAKVIRLELGCKLCPTKLNVYTALQRQSDSEREGCIWQHDIGDEFKCECGRTQYSLKYLKESLHGLLLKNFSSIPTGTGLSFVRMYAHAQIVDVINKFNLLLDEGLDEKAIQEFIELHPIMLARFHATRLFVKPNILGKFETDFAILDTRNRLLLVELEKPYMQLFRQNGHPTAALMHAYGQVHDWLHEYAKHPSAVLESLKLKPGQVLAVRGVVIAGRFTLEILEPLQRHLSSPPYPEIEFLTLDDLPKSVLEISRTLA